MSNNDPTPPRIATGAMFPWPALVCVSLWALLSCVDVQIAYARSEMRVAIDSLGWAAGPGLLPSLLGILLLVVASGLRQYGARGFGRLASLAALLSLARLLSLWQPVAALFPLLSMLWSPHASWALASTVLVVLVPALRATPALAAMARTLTTGRLVGGIFVVATVVYSAWAVYVSQMTMVQGDEAHYLLVTQSLLRDGDIDLHNNGSRQDIAEFRQLPFEMHRAPSSPTGTSYSVHPPGLSALLMPAYAAGVDLWQNPRLACYLFLAGVTAAVLSLLFLWLVRLGYGRWLPLLTIGIIGSTAPTAFYSVQIYPDFAAVLVAAVVLVLLSHWQVAGIRRAALGRSEPLVLFFLAMALGVLPLLHPRFLPLSLGLGLLLLLQAHTSDRRRWSLVALCVAVVLCTAAQIGYHLTISGDWLGHMRPGNAWDDEALKLSTWAVSLPGHWLHATKGAVANAPVLLLAFVGAGRLLRDRDRRLLVAAGLYGVTVVVNGMHPDWTFGFGMPARFLTSGMPALSLLLCAALSFMLRRPTTMFLAAMLLALSWETLALLWTMPTMAYNGEHLFLRSMARFYPLEAHLAASETNTLPLADVLLWLTVVATLVGIGYGFGRGFGRGFGWPWRPTLMCSLSAIAPVLWGWSPTSTARLADRVSPFLLTLADNDPDLRGFHVRHTMDLKHYMATTGRQRADGVRQADGRLDPPGLLTSFYLPFQRRGLHEITVNDYVVDGAHDATDGSPEYVVFTHRRTLPAVQRWETRHYLPVARAEGSFRRPYLVEDVGLGYVYFPFSGQRNMTAGTVNAAFHPLSLRTASHPLPPLTIDAGSAPIFAGADQLLERGRYRARFSLEGNAWSSFLQPHPVSVLMAVLAGAPEDESGLQEMGEHWLHEDRHLQSVFADTHLVRPLVERLQAPWWLHVPGSNDAYDVVFSVPEQRRVRLLLRYDGPATLRLDHISLFEEEILE